MSVQANKSDEYKNENYASDTISFYFSSPNVRK